jgi:hypothetical protein
MYMSNALMFPREALRAIRGARGERFGQLVDRVRSLPECHEESLAFMLMMVQLNGCVSCATDSYRAMNGCGLCALRVLKRFKGTDDDLFDRFSTALREVRAFRINSSHPAADLVEAPKPHAQPAQAQAIAVQMA